MPGAPSSDALVPSSRERGESERATRTKRCQRISWTALHDPFSEFRKALDVKPVLCSFFAVTAV